MDDIAYGCWSLNSAIISVMQSLSLNRPHAIIMVGLPGSGKSFFAKQFADTFNAPYVDIRTIAAHATDTAGAQETADYVVREIAKTKQTFIYEGSTETRAKRTEFSKWARSMGYQPFIVWVQTDQGSALDRTLKQYDVSKEEYADYIRRFSPPHPSESPIVISGKHTYASQARIVLKHLSKERRDSSRSTTLPERTSKPTARTIAVR